MWAKMSALKINPKHVSVALDGMTVVLVTGHIYFFSLQQPCSREPSVMIGMFSSVLFRTVATSRRLLEMWLS